MCVCVCATFADEQTINPLRANWLLNKLVPISMCVRVSLVLMLLVYVCVCMSSLIEKLNIVVAVGEVIPTTNLARNQRQPLGILIGFAPSSRP